MATNSVNEGWEDEWLRLNWRETPHLIEVAYGAGIIRPREYLDASRPHWLAATDQLIRDSVARSLTPEQALALALSS